jgi:eukaryotic-like serine/threonine-protein kinase
LEEKLLTITTGTKLGRYEIRSQLGAGGMGEVYLAQDTKLDRKVALKILPAEVADDQKRMQRFVQEAKAASALNHPNIITIHEIDEANSIHFIATEFIDGETLRRRTARTRLSVAESLGLAIQVASALAAAHEAGILHRDIKPDNIMVRRDGLLKILDFGLAKLTAPESVDPESPTRKLIETESGVVMGTLIYMSPEQARGMTVDARTDIFSLGVLLYEMVAGCLPFEGATTSEILASILNEKEPPPLARFAREVPAELERIVEKALRKDREERYQSTKDMLLDLKRLKQRLEFEAELERSAAPHADVEAAIVTSDRQTPLMADQQTAARRSSDLATARPATSAEYLVSEIKQHKRSVAVGLCALILAVAGAAYFFYFTRTAKAIDSIAVLPLVNASGDPDTEYLSDGLTESLINSLSQLPNIKVISFSSVMHYKGQQIDPQAVGNALRVRAVLMGRIVKNGNAISISAELVDVQDKSHLWGTQYERKLSDLITWKGEIAKDVSEKLRLRLSGDEQKRLTKSYTDNTEAYQLYLKGRYYSAKGTEEEIRKGIEYFNQAINVDPNYALAYAGLSSAYYGLSYIYMPPKEAMPKAKAAALRALELDNNLSEAHTSLAIVKTFYEWDWSGAEREYQQAIELNQNYAPAHEWYGWHLALVGQPDKSILELERAQEIDPLSAEVSWSLGVSLFMARRYDKAITQLLKTLELDPNMPLAHFHLAASYEQQRKSNEAIAEFKKATDLSGGSTLASLGHAYAAFGKRDEALKILDQLKERSARGDLPAFEMAVLYAGLGDKDRTFEWLDKAYDDRSESMAWLKVEPIFDSLRSDERFTKLMQRVGLPQ